MGMKPKRIVLNLNSVIERSITLVERVIGEDIEIITLLEPDLGNVRVDPSQIDQIILDLALNAKNAMPKGGTLIFETRNIHFRESAGSGKSGSLAGEFVRVSITDSGEGMDDATRARIFAPSFTSKDRGKDTRHGLATILGIIKQNNGTIQVHSTPKMGTTFDIYLPRAEASIQNSKMQENLPGIISGSDSILLIEDDIALRGLLGELLEKLGYSVITALSPAHAISIIDDETVGFDLLITDVLLPGISGPQLANHVRKRRPHTKVLFISGHTAEILPESFELADNASFLQKPFSLTVLSGRVRELLRE